MADTGENVNLSRARICIDFGTARSKASVCLDPTLPLEVGVKPLPVGAVSRAQHALLTPSVLYVDGGRIFFGPLALEYAQRGAAQGRDPLLSFKTVLGARDAAAILAQKMRPSVDPTGTLTHRDALVLYLAYLDQLIREALAVTQGMPPGVAEVKRRYTSPVWKAGNGPDRVFEAIFNESAAVSQKLGRLFLSAEGISIAQCKDALDKAIQLPGNGRLETGVFEPHAAAAASLAFTTAPTNFVLVFDIGAGTTDVAAFEFDERTNPPALTEITEARQCSGLAGDEIDRILIEHYFRRRGGDPSQAEEQRVLRMFKLSARELKQQLFAHGKVILRTGGWNTTTIKLSDLTDDPQFREYQAALTRIIAASLTPVVQRAQAVGAQVIDVVLAGGGSHLPFLPDLVRAAAAQNPRSVPLRVSPLSPASKLYDGVDPALGGAFPQIAMSVGGALIEMMPAA
ncbi:MAG: Hsp70 family protein [Proteobacteria bacterium]|nr:Hsp70 family protein [Pseudomonadota bacterium]